MRHTQGFSVVNLLISIVIIIVGIWGASQFAFERELNRSLEKHQSYTTWWAQLRTVTWRSYRDNEFRFTLRYPSSWTLKKETNDSKFPVWNIGRQSEINARVRVRQGSVTCVSGVAFVVVSFGEKSFSVCDVEEEDSLWYITEFSRGKDIYVLSCRYGSALKNCYDFFSSFSFIQ